jgi:predicted AlkP superfamily phosphohydrolase/phosphomutase
MSTSKAGGRVLLIGLDSADAELIETWVAQGHLPAFARMQREGLWSRIGTSAEIMHVSAWPTLYTGTTPGHHGMYHAYQIRGGEQEIHRTDPTQCGQAPFWKFLDDAGKKCVVFDAFMNYKLPGFKGTQILEYGTWTWFGEPGSTPAHKLEEIRRRYGPYPAPEHSNLTRVPDDVAGFRDQLVQGALLKGRVTQDLMRESDWEMMFVSFGEPHGAGHYLWHYGDREYPLAPQQGPHVDMQAVRDVYIAVDQALGGILDQVDDRTTVLIVSGDGMGPNYSGCHLMPEMLHRMGLLYSGNVGQGAQGSKAPKKGLLSKVRQAIPLGMRESVTRCLPRSLRYKLSMKWVNSGTDWTRSQVFCIPNSNEAYFRVNLRGREPQGIVATGTQYDEVLGNLRDKLNGLTNPVNGKRAAERVTLMDEQFLGPRRKDLPDAVISWNLDARVLDQIATPGIEPIRKQPGYEVSPFYTGNHRATAFLAARGPAVAAGSSLQGANILDVAPTMLAFLGVDAPAHFEGRVLESLL